jgi:hypothetical protein
LPQNRATYVFYVRANLAEIFAKIVELIRGSFDGPKPQLVVLDLLS